MDQIELFSMPQLHTGFVACVALPWPHDGYGYVGCCHECAEVSPSARSGYAGALADVLAHVSEQRRNWLDLRQ